MQIDREFEICYTKGERCRLVVKAHRLSRCDVYAEICFAEALLVGHKPSDPTVTFEGLAKSAGIELISVRILEEE